METVLWIGGGVLALIGAAALVEAWVKRGRHRPLVAVRPTDLEDPDATEPPLGMEAVDRSGFLRRLRAAEGSTAQAPSTGDHLRGRRR